MLIKTQLSQSSELYSFEDSSHWIDDQSILQFSVLQASVFIR